MLHTYGVPWLTQQITEANDYFLNPNYNPGPDNVPQANEPAIATTPQGLLADTAEVVQVASEDPNNIFGPKGSGANHFVPNLRSLPYMVTFMNQPTASAPLSRSS